MDITQIERVANELRARYNPNAVAPFPYIALEAGYPGLHIFFEPMEEGLLGNLLEQDIGQIVIRVNSQQPVAKQHFTFGKLLGHALLHQDLLHEKKSIALTDHPIATTRDVFDVEASQFADFLLLPTDLVTKAWYSLGKLESCADVFCVTPATFGVRMERLGLLST